MLLYLGGAVQFLPGLPGKKTPMSDLTSVLVSVSIAVVHLP